MILSAGSGAKDYTLLGMMDAKAWRFTKHNTVRILKARGQEQAARWLEEIPFEAWSATNYFGDEFFVLHAKVSFESYERLRKLQESDSTPIDFQFKRIRDTASEVSGEHFRIAGVQYELEDPPAPAERRLSGEDVFWVVEQYLGVEDGYLADFTYKSHHEFYLALDLDIDPNELDGTTRERFIKILRGADADSQRRILRGVLRKYPPGSTSLRTGEKATQIAGMIERLAGNAAISVAPSTSEFVQGALADANELLRSRGPKSAVDRMHSALHGQVVALCREVAIPVEGKERLTSLLKQLRKQHPALNPDTHRGQDIARILTTLGAVVDALGPIRNQASMAHPNDLLDDPEAHLVINAVKTLMNYLNAVVSRAETDVS